MEKVHSVSNWSENMKNAVNLFVAQKIINLRPDFRSWFEEICENYTNEKFENIINY